MPKHRHLPRKSRKTPAPIMSMQMATEAGTKLDITVWDDDRTVLTLSNHDGARVEMTPSDVNRLQVLLSTTNNLL